jgi:hypothetical protein
MPTKPKQTADKFFPEMGRQYEVGLANVGISVVDATIVAGNATVQTDAQVIAGPPNTSAVVNASGPIVHSLGAVPSVALLFPRSGSMGTGTHFIYMTADNSAVYFRAKSWTQDALGYAVRMVAIR